MAIVFIVEDGTGLATATSMVDVATAVAYWSNRPNDTRGVTFLGLNLTGQQDALIRASDYIRQHGYPWRGIKKTYAQRMPFPRTSLTEALGQPVPDNVVPWQVQDAVCLVAGRIATGETIFFDLDRGGRIQTETIGPISTTYFDDAPGGIILQEVDGLLWALLTTSQMSLPVGIDMQWVQLPDVFANDAFTPFTTASNFRADNPPGSYTP